MPNKYKYQCLGFKYRPDNLTGILYDILIQHKNKIGRFILLNDVNLTDEIMSYMIASLFIIKTKYMNSFYNFYSKFSLKHCYGYTTDITALNAYLVIDKFMKATDLKKMNNYEYCVRNPKFKIRIFGNVNTGRSTIINNLIGENKTEVSDKKMHYENYRIYKR